MHALGELVRVARFEVLADLEAEVFDEVEVVEHALVGRLALGLLVGQDGARAARVAREEHEQVVLEIVKRVLRNLEGRHGDAACFVDLEAGEPTEGGNVLVLFSDGLFQAVDFDRARGFGELVRRHVLTFHRVERAQDAHRERSGRTKPRARRKVGDAHELDARRNLLAHEGLAQDAVLDVLGPRHPLELRVLHAVVRSERAVVERDVDVLVDGRRDDEAAVVLVVGREVGAPASDGHAEGRAGDNHGGGTLEHQGSRIPPPFAGLGATRAPLGSVVLAVLRPESSVRPLTP